MKHWQRRVTFAEEDRKDRRLTLLEDDYASDPAYVAIPEKATPTTVHYWRVDEIELYARARLLRDTISDLVPDADADAFSLQHVLFPEAPK